METKEAYRDTNFETRVVRQTILDWVTSQHPIDRALNETLREHKVGANQRGVISQAVYDMIRFWPMNVEVPAKPQNPDWLRALDERVRFLLTSPHYDILQAHSTAQPTFEKDAAAHLRRIHGAPDFLVAEMMKAPKPWHVYLHQMFSEAPLTVRLNTTKGKTADFLKQYHAQGVTPCAWAPDAFHFAKRWPIVTDAGYLSGLFEIQDEHSQLVSLLADPKPGETVLDMCAGAGGKTLHLASLMQNKGEITAFDISKSKLSELHGRARRAGLTNVRVAETLPTKQKFDLIMIDAPCSGLGTLRRTPDRLYRFTDSEAKKLASVQMELLQRARTLLAPGGRILFATCTVRPEEGLSIIHRATTSGAALKGGDLKANVQKALGAKAADFLTLVAQTPAARILPDVEALRNSFLQLGPSSQTSGGLTGDGFFLSLVN